MAQEDTLEMLRKHFSGNDKPQLKDINNHVVIKCAANWKQLGKNLNINEDLLNIIEKNYPDCEDCCSKMLSDWLDLTPHASWETLLNAVDETKNTSYKVPDMVEKLETVAGKLTGTVEMMGIAAEKLPDTVEKLDTAAEKLPDTVKKLGTAADMLPETVEKLDTAVEKLFNTVENLGTTANKLPVTVETLSTAADKVDSAADKLEYAAVKIPNTVEKLDSAADKVPKAVDQLCEAIDKLPKVVGKVNIVENTDLNDFTGKFCSFNYYDSLWEMSEATEKLLI